MANKIVRPTSAVSSVWFDPTVINIDDGVTEPSAGDDFVAEKRGTSTQVQAWNLATPSNTGTITDATVWMYAACDASDGDGIIDEVRINLNGSWYSYGSGWNTLTVGTYQWWSFNFTGSFGDMATSAPVIELTGSGDGGSSSRIYLDVLYLGLTYTPGGGGGGGLPGASGVVKMTLIG